MMAIHTSIASARDALAVLMGLSLAATAPEKDDATAAAVEMIASILLAFDAMAHDAILQPFCINHLFLAQQSISRSPIRPTLATIRDDFEKLKVTL